MFLFLFLLFLYLFYFYFFICTVVFLNSYFYHLSSLLYILFFRIKASRSSLIHYLQYDICKKGRSWKCYKWRGTLVRIWYVLTMLIIFSFSKNVLWCTTFNKSEFLYFCFIWKDLTNIAWIFLNLFDCWAIN